jgi:hypothetical protein
MTIASDERALRIAELVHQLTGCGPAPAHEAVTGGFRPTISTDGALELAARAITELHADARRLRVAPYLVPGQRATAAVHRPPVGPGPDWFDRASRRHTHRLLGTWSRPGPPGRATTG